MAKEVNEEGYVTKRSWLQLREPFERVYNGDAEQVTIPELGVKIYIGKRGVVRIDVKQRIVQK